MAAHHRADHRAARRAVSAADRTADQRTPDRAPDALALRLAGTGWRDTCVELPAGRWTDLLTGRTHTCDGTAGVAAAGLLDWPVALLVREAG